MILARFHDAGTMQAAQRRLAAAGLAAESYGPTPPDPLGRSPVPAIMLGVGLLAAVGAFAMQCYATTWGYRIDIGGRPDLFWPPYIPFALEAGLFAAMLAGFVSFLVAAQLPYLHDPVDDTRDFPRVSQDAWFLAVPGEPGPALDILADAASVEALPG